MARGLRLAVLTATLPALLALAGVLASPAAAEHEPDHRYFVIGTVTDELGEGLCGLTVRVSDVSVPSSLDTNRTAVTDGSGRYVVQLHLHDAVVQPTNNNVGDTLLVWVEGTSAQKTTVAQVNNQNPEGWGQQTVDLSVVGGKGTCPDLVLYAGAGAGVTAGIVVPVWWLRRPRRGGRGASVGADVMSLPGMNRARARALAKSGVRTVEGLAGADPETLAQSTSLTPKEARLLVKRAQEGVKGKAP